MDRTTEMLASYACRISFEELDDKTIHQVKRTLVDTMGCAMGGFVSDPAKIARGMASTINLKLNAGCLVCARHMVLCRWRIQIVDGEIDREFHF